MSWEPWEGSRNQLCVCVCGVGVLSLNFHLPRNFSEAEISESLRAAPIKDISRAMCTEARIRIVWAAGQG